MSWRGGNRWWRSRRKAWWESRRRLRSRLRGRKCRDLIPDKPELILGQLLALQDGLEVEQSLETLLNRRIKGIVREVCPGSRYQGFYVAVQSAKVDGILTRLRCGLRVLLGGL